MSPRPNVSKERTAQILDAAVRVFGRLGIGRARMEDIAVEAGLSKGTVYLYFRSKDALVGALLERFFQRALKPLPAMIDSNRTVAERLRELADLMVAETRRSFAEMPLSLELYAVAARLEKVRSFLRNSFSASYKLLARLIRQGIERGEFRPIENAEDAAVVAGALFEGLALLAAIDPSSVDWGRHGAAAVDILLQGLKA